MSGQAQSKSFHKERNSLPAPTTAAGATTVGQTGFGAATEKASDKVKVPLRKRVSRFSPRQTRQSRADSSKVSVVNF